MNLLEELKALKPKLPETECFVVEWNRSVTIRSFTVLEGRKLRQSMSKSKDGEDGEDDKKNEELYIKTIAHAIADGDERPLANKQGIEMIESLSELTVRRLMAAYMRITIVQDVEGNSEPRADGASSSTDSPSPSAGRSLN